MHERRLRARAARLRPTLSDHAAIVEALADRLGSRFHLVGHSHGGAVAITYAADRAETLVSMTLVEPTLMHLLRICSKTEAWPEAEELGNRHIKAVAEGRSAEIADDFMPYWIGQAAWQGMPEDRRTAIIATMPAVAQFWTAVFAETTPAQTYEGIRVPTLLIRGSNTRATTHTIIDILSDLLPNSCVEDIEGAGHMAPLTHAPQVNAAIAAHVLQSSSTELDIAIATSIVGTLLPSGGVEQMAAMAQAAARLGSAYVH